MKTIHDPEFIEMLSQDLVELTQTCPSPIKLTGISEPDETLQWLRLVWPSLTTSDVRRIVHRILHATGPVPEHVKPSFWETLNKGLVSWMELPFYKAIQQRNAGFLRELSRATKYPNDDGPVGGLGRTDPPVG